MTTEQMDWVDDHNPEWQAKLKRDRVGKRVWATDARKVSKILEFIERVGSRLGTHQLTEAEQSEWDELTLPDNGVSK